MINKDLLKINKASNKYIVLTVLYNFIVLFANVYLIYVVATFFSKLLLETLQQADIGQTVLRIGLVFVIRLIFAHQATLVAFHASTQIKTKLRELIISKLFKTQKNYKQALSSAEIMQLAGEGVEHLELYYGRYLPQFFYSLMAPIILFFILANIDITVATVLLIAVPLIPISIIIVQKIAKKLLGQYWKAYTKLGDRFLDNLQGLTTLKIFQADNHYLELMDQEAESFRKATMRVLIMQLNSIVVMDLVAYLGASVGIIFGLLSFQAGNITLSSTIFIVLISADFFIPMRQLGSLFHVAMNGLAASKKIFAFLHHQVEENGEIKLESLQSLRFNQVSFQFLDASTPVLSKVNFNLPTKGLTVVVGPSGAGKSTLASLIQRLYLASEGVIEVNGRNINDYEQDSLFEHITYLSNQSHVFKGTLKENLQLGFKQASDEAMLQALNMVDLDQFVLHQGGLMMLLEENGNNLSTGQRQRLVLARNLLKKTSLMILDEITANIDAESEEIIMNAVKALSLTQGILMISHRLYHAYEADHVIYVSENKEVIFSHHQELMKTQVGYRQLVTMQQELEAALEVHNA